MKTTLKNDRGISLVVVLMIMVLLLSITGAGLIFSGTGLRTAGAFRAGTQAFYGADTGANVGISQLQLNQALATAAIPDTDLGNGTRYRGGRRNGADPGPRYMGDVTHPGFTPGSGTPDYSGSGSPSHTFNRYQINVTGTGPIGAVREIEVQAEYGPLE